MLVIYSGMITFGQECSPHSWLTPRIQNQEIIIVWELFSTEELTGLWDHTWHGE